MAADAELERLVATLTGDASTYMKMLNDAQVQTAASAKKIEATTAKMSSGFGKTLSELGTKMSNMAGQFRAMAAIESPFGFMKEGVSLAADAEMMETQFGTMLRSVELGKQMVEDLTRFAAETPLNMPGLQATTKTLLQFGVAGDQIIPTIKMLGDAASGEQDKLSRLAIAFGQARSAGRLMGEEVAQMREAGFNPLVEISRTTGKSMAVLTDEMSKGKISVTMMENAFRTATGAGGMFEDGMKKASRTAKGLWSTMMDDIDAVKRTVGQLIITQLQLKAVMETISETAQRVTKSLKEMDSEQKALISGTAVLLGSIGSAVVAWKVGAIAIGMFIGVFKDIIGTTKWLVAGFYNWIRTLSLTATAVSALDTAIIALRFTMAALPWAALVIGAGEAIHAIIGTKDAIAALNAESERGKKISGELREVMSKAADKKLTAALEIKTPEGKMKELERLIAQSEMETKGISKNFESANKELESMSGISDQLIRASWIPVVGRGEVATFKALKYSVEESAKSLEAAKASGKRLREELAKVKEEIEKSDEPMKKAVGELTKKYELAAATIGMTTEEVELFKLKSDFKIPVEELSKLDSLIEFAKAGKEADKLKKDIETLTLSLSKEVETMGMSSTETKLFELRTKGASKEALKSAEAWAASAEFLDRHNKLMESGIQVTKQFMTPLEKFNERQAELQEMFDVGAISEEIFGKAMLDAQNELDGVGEKAKDAKEELQGLNAVLAGSAEAQRRISAYLDMMDIKQKIAEPKMMIPAPQNLPAPMQPAMIPQGGWPKPPVGMIPPKIPAEVLKEFDNAVAMAGIGHDPLAKLKAKVKTPEELGWRIPDPIPAAAIPPGLKVKTPEELGWRLPNPDPVKVPAMPELLPVLDTIGTEIADAIGKPMKAVDNAADPERKAVIDGLKAIETVLNAILLKPGITIAPVDLE